MLVVHGAIAVGERERGEESPGTLDSYYRPLYTLRSHSSPDQGH